MTACVVVAFGAVSPLGEGRAALGAAAGATPRSAATRDPELERLGLRRPFCARAAGEPVEAGTDGAAPHDRARALVERALEPCARALDLAYPSWRTRRVGLVLGTSSGGMRAFERVVAAREDAGALSVASWIAATYLGPVVTARIPFAVNRFATVLGACASSTLAIGVAKRWLEHGHCDLVVAGGYDEVTPFVAAGFEALRAVAVSGRARPFSLERDGLVLGEGAAVVALARAGDAGIHTRLGHVLGAGASCDAAHLTAPDARGAGLVRAARAALADARVDAARVALVSAHGTGTEANDAAEANAIRALALRPTALVHALKGETGHTLGAAGALETVAALTALASGSVPAGPSAGALEPGVAMPDAPAALDGDVALKLSAAFGGANAALVLGGVGVAPLDRGPGGASALPAPGGSSAPRPVLVTRAVHLDAAHLAEHALPARLAARTSYPEQRLARADALVRDTLAAALELRDVVGFTPSDRIGLVVGHGLATMQTNGAYWLRALERGVTRVEPRTFPYTTPNACAGECAVALGLRGPAFAAGAGVHGGLEAIALAGDLVAGGDADAIVVVAVDAVGPFGAHLGGVRGAVATWVCSEAPDVAHARLSCADLSLPRSCPELLGACHEALVPLASGRPSDLSDRAGFAKLSLFWL